MAITKSSKKVLSEIEFLIKKYKINHLKIIDDNFFVDIKRVREIAEGILQKKLKITWDVECRTDYFRDGFVDDKILPLVLYDMQGLISRSKKVTISYFELFM